MKLLPDNKQHLNEVIFENRNKAYGAYALRRDEDKRTLAGLLFTCTVFVALAMASTLGGPVIEDIKKGLQQNLMDTITFVNNFEDIKEPEKNREQPKTASQPKTDPGNNFQASNKDADSLRTNKDLKDLVIGPKNPDTSSTGGPDTKGKVVVVKPADTDTIPFRFVANMPEFGGDFMGWLKKNTRYPTLALENGITGTVYVNFVIDESGAVSRLKVENPTVNDILEKEALRVLSACPKWKPGNDGARNVKVAMTVPMRFSLK